MPKDSRFFAYTRATGKGSKVMISDETGIRAHVRGWKLGIIAELQAGLIVEADTCTLWATEGTGGEDILIGTLVLRDGEVALIPSLWTRVQCERSPE